MNNKEISISVETLHELQSRSEKYYEQKEEIKELKWSNGAMAIVVIFFCSISIGLIVQLLLCTG